LSPSVASVSLGEKYNKLLYDRFLVTIQKGGVEGAKQATIFASELEVMESLSLLLDMHFLRHPSEELRFLHVSWAYLRKVPVLPIPCESGHFTGASVTWFDHAVAL
jgi:hypothetical protein